jgi:RimJ/RimL family protein N-acetyltransferase
VSAGVTVRAATEADVDRMVDLYSAVADEGRWIGAEAPVDGEELRRRWGARVADGEGVLLVAEAGGAGGLGGLVVGHAILDLAPYGVAYLGMLVDREWRRRGVGSALVGAVIDAARNHGCHKVSLQVWPHNEGAIALYRTFGFEEEGVLRRHYPRRNGELWDAMVMGLLLSGGRAG